MKNSRIYKRPYCKRKNAVALESSCYYSGVLRGWWGREEGREIGGKGVGMKTLLSTLIYSY